MKRTYTIIGTGALGGYYGFCLDRAGAEVNFLLHRDFAHVREHGLLVETGGQAHRLQPVRAHGRAEDLPPADVAVIALKTTQNAALPRILPHALKADGVALVLQNGLGIEDEVAARVGPDRVLGGLCFLCSNKVGPGHIRHLDYGQIVLGEHRADHAPGGVTARLREIAADFERGGVPISLAEDLVAARWKKLVWNVPYNALSVILRATTDRLMADPATRDLVEAIMVEVVETAAACGKAVDPAFIRKMLDDTVRMKPYRPSMKIDFDEGRPLEVEAIYGNPWRAGVAAGREPRRIGTLYRQLQFLDPGRQPASQG